MRNLLSIDLEDWFCVSNFDELLGRERWDACELRVVQSTRRLLELFDRRGVQATFFVLGWVAERAPELIREVAAAGHEVACHGYHHHRLGHLDPARLDADLRRALPLLRELAGAEVVGYRAPSFSLTRETLWAVPVLERHGVRWDSSVFPFGAHPEYGIADAPLDPYLIGEQLVELPMSVVELGARGETHHDPEHAPEHRSRRRSTLRYASTAAVSLLGLGAQRRTLGRAGFHHGLLGRRRLPCTGGGYFRLYPYELSAALIRRCNRAGRPAIFYAHPWEFDPEQPRMPLPPVKRFRHYNNLANTLARLDRLLAEFEWGPMGPWAEHARARLSGGRAA